MEIFSRKPQVKFETGHQRLDPLLGNQQRHHVVLS